MMASEWQTEKLGSLVSFRTGKLDSNAAVEKGSYPFFTCSQDTLRTNSFSFDTECVLLAGNNANGIFPLKYFKGKFDAYQRTYVVRPIDAEALSTKFLYYSLCMKLEELQRLSTGAATKFLTLTILNATSIKVPHIAVQRKLVEVLWAYDELIENNKRRISVLEEVARSVYREWFVHFRFPGHEDHAIVSSSFGQTPQGWEVCPIELLLSFQIGGGWGKDTEDEQHGQAAWVIRGTDIPQARNSATGSVPHRYHASSNLRSRRLEPDDIVFEVSGGSKGQPVGRSLLVTRELLSAFHGDAVMCASFCKRIKPNVDRYRSELLYLSFVEGYYSGEIEQYQVQSTGISNFKWTEYIANTHRVVPPQVLQEAFCAVVKPIFKSIACLGLQSANLRKTRDLLLPRLLSGQIKLEAN